MGSDDCLSETSGKYRMMCACACCRGLLQAHDAAYQRWVPAQGPHTGASRAPSLLRNRLSLAYEWTCDAHAPKIVAGRLGEEAYLGPCTRCTIDCPVHPPQAASACRSGHTPLPMAPSIASMGPVPTPATTGTQTGDALGRPWPQIASHLAPR